MIPKEYECREGNGIKLFINPESNYGLTHYVPIQEDHPYYEIYQKWKKSFDESPTWVYKNLNREDTEHFIHCMGCNSLKINNFERYCRICPDFYDFWSKTRS